LTLLHHPLNVAQCGPDAPRNLGRLQVAFFDFIAQTGHRHAAVRERDTRGHVKRQRLVGFDGVRPASALHPLGDVRDLLQPALRSVGEAIESGGHLRQLCVCGTQRGSLIG
jgi:hypothetical protein